MNGDTTITGTDRGFTLRNFLGGFADFLKKRFDSFDVIGREAHSMPDIST